VLDPENPVVKLCAAGMEAEAQGRPNEARALFEQAWAERVDAVDACIAAHYVARHQDSAEDTFRWNRESLVQAEAADPAAVASLLPSLCLNLGHSHEVRGEIDVARELYERAAHHARGLEDDRYGAIVRGGIAAAMQRIDALLAGEGE
jgi:hypothetical protein